MITDEARREQHVGVVDTVLQAEMGYGIVALQDYLDKLVKQSSNRNFMFDSHYTATKAWADLFDGVEQRGIFERAISEARSNKDIGGQVGYYMDAWNKAFA